MEIIVGRTAGFCGGMQHAVTKAEEILEREGQNIYGIGELAHNPQVMDSLKKKGLVVVSGIEEVPDGKSAIVRAHGVAKEVYEEAKRRNIKLWDLTCAKVLKVHEKAEQYAKQGYYLFLVAEEGHPETIGTFSFCGKNASIVMEETQIEEAVGKWRRSGSKKAVILSQTTFSMEKFNVIAQKLQQPIADSCKVVVDKTICDATRNRQTETAEIAQKVDYLWIIGGKNSSNTHKLYEIAKKNCKNANWIQTEKQIGRLPKVAKIGVMAGASTPRKTIEDVVKTIKEKQS